MTISVISSHQIERIIGEYLAKEFGDEEIRQASQSFRRDGYVKVRNLVPPEVFDAASSEVYRLIDLHAKRIDLKMKETSDSPRYMSTVSAQAIMDDGEIIPAIYDSPSLRSLLSRLAGESVLPCPWDGERYVITRQHKKGDTHGWHWGDFSFTVIWVIEAPDLDCGGALQCVPHTDWDKSNPQVVKYLLDNPIRTYGHVTGDLYFLRSDTTLHRTIPLSVDRVRIILNTCWGSEKDQEKDATHETMSAMFD
ncbi:ArpA protein [Streptomyces sp. NPDC021218]|uniref:HalD/BesD family halogenase n=1 Tax=Streptomyces sp. NPDC021218 TaxID=3365119 RepID=UPI00378ACC59